MSKVSHGAYHMTPSRRAALRKAQRAAAIKRHQRAKRNKRLAVGAGVLAGVGAGIVLGRSTKTGAPKSANPANTGVKTMSVKARETVMKAGAISPPRSFARFRLRKAIPVVPGMDKPPTPPQPPKPRQPNPSAAEQKAAMEAATSKARVGIDDITGLPTRDYNPAFRAPRVRKGKVSVNAAMKAAKKDEAAKIAMGAKHENLRSPGTRNALSDGNKRSNPRRCE